ncbi:MAG: hypothetical protein LC799_03100 [Actinobacteria bacterium]|nr:hypothetical protein [Actinomycetota bacterium]
MTLFAITQAVRAGWQRQAARELAAILDVHRDLPIIGWTIGTAGAVLVGHVSGLASGGQVRRVFDTWRRALMLTEYRERTSAGGTTYLYAGASCDRVRVRLTATVTADDDGDVTLDVTP